MKFQLTICLLATCVLFVAGAQTQKKDRNAEVPKVDTDDESIEDNRFLKKSIKNSGSNKFNNEYMENQQGGYPQLYPQAQTQSQSYPQPYPQPQPHPQPYPLPYPTPSPSVRLNCVCTPVNTGYPSYPPPPFGNYPQKPYF